MKILSTGEVLWEGEADDTRDALQKAVAADAYLAGANLANAYLANANLADANLANANLAEANLGGANLAWANLACANLADAYLAGANLADAYLANAYLAGANLGGASLANANLAGANLANANLADANLERAKGINAYRTTPLLMFYDQPGPIRAYKLVTGEGMGPFNGGILYEVGHDYAVEHADTDISQQCAAGINVATLDWCMREWQPSYRILVVEFVAADIAAIPTATDGKFRLHRCKIVGEKDLRELGLIGAEEVR